jgi:sporulation protein YlmC with PRC-barrel domain
MHVFKKSLALVVVAITVIAIRSGTASQDLVLPLYKMRDVLGHKVATQEGKEVGHIDNVILDASSGDIAYAVVTSGGVLRLGNTLRMLPWSVLHLATGSAPFQLQISQEQFNNAPQFHQDEWPDMEDRHWEDAIQVYYGKLPYWGKRVPSQTNTPVAQGPRPILRARSLLQSRIMNPRGQRLGEIEEVVIDATAGEVAYVVLAFGEFPQLKDKWFALSWQALQQSKGLGTFMLDVDARVLAEASGFNKDRWPQKAQDIKGVGN